MAHPQLTLSEKKQIIATWKWRWMRLGFTTIAAAQAMNRHQGNLSDLASGKRACSMDLFWEIEDWTAKEEKKKKIK